MVPKQWIEDRKDIRVLGQVDMALEVAATYCSFVRASCRCILRHS